MKKEFSVHQTLALKAFPLRNKDYTVIEIFIAVYGPEDFSRVVNSCFSINRYMQQRLAPTFSNINKKLKARGNNHRIVPGKLKRTYRYSTKG